jgi:lipoprotein-anchoring transpeptidase ErfK/SrfK
MYCRRDVDPETWSEMLRRLILLSSVALCFSAVSAQAQYRDADVYFDGNGNRVIVDRATGEVIAVQPRRFNRERERSYGGNWQDERYDPSDPDDMARMRRDDQRYDDDYVLREPDYSEPDYSDRDYRTDEFPEAPPGTETIARGEPIERQPLGNGDIMTDDPETTGTIVPSDQMPLATEPAAPAPINIKGREDVAALQVLLDRAGASPGVIDGRFGSNVDKALVAYAEITGQNLRSTDIEGIKAALAASGGDAFALYEITPEDAAGPYVASIPADYGEKAKLERMAYTSVTEALAERFHMDEAYLKALNPEADFNRPGTRVRVVNFGRTVSTKVQKIIADKGKKQVFAYDANGKLVAAYPATIGSSDTPSPTGIHAVSRIAINPNYTYNPKINFKQGENDKVLTIPPGPNGPVGSVWIALDKPTYGIHGTPDPSKIGKTESHGCIRLTNFDAQELAKLVSNGVLVEFVE